MHMVRHRHRLIIRSVLLTGAALLSAQAEEPSKPPSHAASAGEPFLRVRDADKELKQTIVTAHLRQPHVPGKNLLWCASFQLAWDELSGQLNGPVQLDGDPEMAKVLNEHLVDNEAVDQGSSVARAGFARDHIIEKIRAELDRVFNGAASPERLPDPATLSPDDIVAYAYLFKNLAFETPFLSLARPIHFGESRVSGFGLGNSKLSENINWGERAQQVRIATYQSPARFSVELLTKSEGDHLILARRPPASTLSETVRDTIGEFLEAKPEKVKENDQLLIPNMDFDINRFYREVIGRNLVHRGYEDCFVKDARQGIRFRLDKLGAMLKSEAYNRILKAIPEQQPRIMSFDGPFLILMMRKDAKMPYFALWVENPELLVPWKEVAK